MSVTKTMKTKLRIMTPNNCWYCGEGNPSTVDHVRPKSLGGGDDMGNLVLACKSCNSSKKDMLVSAFRFHVSWSKTKYYESINSTAARKLLKQGVVFSGFQNNHKFWFEGL